MSAPTTLYGCIYESAEALVSLHASKAGAWRAMHAARFAAEVEMQEDRLRHGKRSLAAFMLSTMSFRMRPVEVLP